MTTQEAPTERTSALNRHVVRRIKMELAVRDWHQSDLARKLGEGEKWISRRMRLELSLSLDELERIAAIFGLGASDLLDPNGPKVSRITATKRGLAERLESNGTTEALTDGPVGLAPKGDASPVLPSGARRPRRLALAASPMTDAHAVAA